MLTGSSPGPVGGRQGGGKPHRSARPLGNVPPIDTSAPEYLDFIARVLKAATADRLRKGRKQFSDIAHGDLAPIENGKVMRKEAAARCIELLKDARAALAGEQWGPPADAQAMAQQGLARNAHSIGIASAYRSHADERRIWTHDCFPKYYKETYPTRMAATGGPHGEKAVNIIVRYFSPRKSPPGFSNHSNGKAVDFMTRQGRVTYTANTSQRSGWRKTWLHEWLVHNAEQYGFHPLASEEWHWEFR
jgi:D-alanyl-D-alanine carboxypeptidase